MLCDGNDCSRSLVAVALMCEELLHADASNTAGHRLREHFQVRVIPLLLGYAPFTCGEAMRLRRVAEQPPIGSDRRCARIASASAYCGRALRHAAIPVRTRLLGRSDAR
jgi:hypothetical protein